MKELLHFSSRIWASGIASSQRLDNRRIQKEEIYMANSYDTDQTCTHRTEDHRETTGKFEELSPAWQQIRPRDKSKVKAWYQ